MKRLSELLQNNNKQLDLSDYYKYSPEYIGFPDSDTMKYIYTDIISDLLYTITPVYEINPKRFDLYKLLNISFLQNGKIPNYTGVKINDWYDDVITNPPEKIQNISDTNFHHIQTEFIILAVLNDIENYNSDFILQLIDDRYSNDNCNRLILVLPINDAYSILSSHTSIIPHFRAINIKYYTLNTNLLKLTI